MQRKPYIAAILLSVTLASCWGLPKDFSELSLDEKIAAYERRIKRGGAESMEARAHISWHGYEAAERMLPYLKGESKGIPRQEALKIVWDVQLRGCSLRGTEIEAALEDYARNPALDNADRVAVEGALTAIQADQHLKPGQLDGLTGGPCESGSRHG